MTGRIASGLAVVCVAASLLFMPVASLAGSGSGTEPTEKETIQFKRRETPVPTSASRVIGILLLGLTTGVGALIVLRRNLQRKGVIPSVSGSRIAVLEMKRLNAKLSVFLIAVDNKEYLFLQSGEQSQVIRHDNSPAAESEHGS